MPSQRDVLLGAGLALAAAVAHLPALWTDFTADDYFILARIQQLGGLADSLAYFRFGFFDYYRPLGFLSHALDWELWGLEARGFHLTGIVLHALNTGLVFALARRVAGTGAAAVAALFFGMHAASHEVVYWMAARFDLLATMLTLTALVGWTAASRAGYASAIVAFGLALLAKEAAAAFPLAAAAWDVFVRRLGWQDTARRLAPLLLVAAGYAILRTRGAELAVAGGRLPKLLLLAGGLAALLVVAWIGADAARGVIARLRLRSARAWMVVVIGVAAAGTAVPLTSQWVFEKLGFVAYAAFTILVPLAFPPPPPWPFVPSTIVEALPGLAVLAAGLTLVWTGRRWLVERPEAVFAASFICAAVLPVLSMTGGVRYLYLATAAASMLVGIAVLALARARPAFAAALVAAWVIVSAVQLGVAAREWRWAGDMTRDAIDLMTDTGPDCADRDVVLLTAPAGIRGVYSNLLWDALAVRTPCPPATIATVLRVVRLDASVMVTRSAPSIIDLRVRDYRGQIVTSADLRRFDIPIRAGATSSIETPLGRLETWPEDGDQRFRLTLVPGAERADYFAYGDGALRRVGGPP